VVKYTIVALLLMFQSHYITISWTDNVNPAGTTYNIYRATGSCAASFTQIQSGVGVLSYNDSPITYPGTYCYYVTAYNASFSNPESVPSVSVIVTDPATPFGTQTSGQVDAKGNVKVDQ
jgi:hypothetical protein